MTSAELQQWRDRMNDNQAVAATLELALIMRGILDELKALRQHAAAQPTVAPSVEAASKPVPGTNRHATPAGTPQNKSETKLLT
jgi:hypothetical protein